MSHSLVAVSVLIGVTRAGRWVWPFMWTDGRLNNCGLGFCSWAASLMCAIHFALCLAGPVSVFIPSWHTNCFHVLTTTQGFYRGMSVFFIELCSLCAFIAPVLAMLLLSVQCIHSFY